MMSKLKFKNTLFYLLGISELVIGLILVYVDYLNGFPIIKENLMVIGLFAYIAFEIVFGLKWIILGSLLTIIAFNIYNKTKIKNHV